MYGFVLFGPDAAGMLVPGMPGLFPAMPPNFIPCPLSGDVQTSRHPFDCKVFRLTAAAAMLHFTFTQQRG